MRKTTFFPGQLLLSVHMEKFTSSRRVFRLCTMGNQPLNIAQGQQKLMAAVKSVRPRGHWIV